MKKLFLLLLSLTIADHVSAIDLRAAQQLPLVGFSSQSERQDFIDCFAEPAPGENVSLRLRTYTFNGSLIAEHNLPLSPHISLAIPSAIGTFRIDRLGGTAATIIGCSRISSVNGADIKYENLLQLATGPTLTRIIDRTVDGRSDYIRVLNSSSKTLELRRTAVDFTGRLVLSDIIRVPANGGFDMLLDGLHEYISRLTLAPSTTANAKVPYAVEQGRTE